MRFLFPNIDELYSDPESYRKLLKYCNVNWFNGSYDAKTKILFIVGDNLTQRNMGVNLTNDYTNLRLNQSSRVSSRGVKFNNNYLKYPTHTKCLY